MLDLRPALLVIDMLKEFVYGRLRSPSAITIVPSIKVLIEKAHEKNVPVIYLADKHYPFDNELKIWGPHAMINDKESEVIEDLKPSDRDLVLYKRSYSGFRDTGLALILRDLGVDTVILTGIHTHICVLHTAIDAYYERFKLIVAEDAVAAFSKEDHEYALRYMQQVLGAELKTTRQLVELLDKL
ncbi:MAG: isochorismatase family cysteine hydrolase [Desulfurococcaceae archaeon]